MYCIFLFQQFPINYLDALQMGSAEGNLVNLVTLICICIYYINYLENATLKITEYTFHKTFTKL